MNGDMDLPTEPSHSPEPFCSENSGAYTRVAWPPGARWTRSQKTDLCANKADWAGGVTMGNITQLSAFPCGSRTAGRATPTANKGQDTGWIFSLCQKPLTSRILSPPDLSFLIHKIMALWSLGLSSSETPGHSHEILYMEAIKNYVLVRHSYVIITSGNKDFVEEVDHELERMNSKVWIVY